MDDYVWTILAYISDMLVCNRKTKNKHNLRVTGNKQKNGSERIKICIAYIKCDSKVVIP